MESWRGFFETWGSRTLETNCGGERLIFTDEPENIKAVLATQFGDYGKGKDFHEEWHEFLGDSIFTTDLDLWHQSRQLLRPLFVKDRISDLDTFERHFQILLPKLSGNGEEVDVKALFFCLTLDVATDFLLGKSVGSLDNPKVSGWENTADLAASSVELRLTAFDDVPARLSLRSPSARSRGSRASGLDWGKLLGASTSEDTGFGPLLTWDAGPVRFTRSGPGERTESISRCSTTSWFRSSKMACVYHPRGSRRTNPIMDTPSCMLWPAARGTGRCCATRSSRCFLREG